MADKSIRQSNGGKGGALPKDNVKNVSGDSSPGKPPKENIKSK